MTELAKEIVNFRARERLSLQEFAERAGVSLQTIHFIETGQTEPSRVTVAKIRLVLDAGQEKEE